MKKLSIWLILTFVVLLGFTSCEVNEPFEACPDISIKVDNETGSAVYRFVAQLDSVQNVRFTWSVDGEDIDTGNLDDLAGQIFDYRFEPGKHTVCVKIASDDCPLEVCTDIDVKRNEDDPCPDLFFESRNYERPSVYKFIADFEGIERMTYEWFVNDELIANSSPNDDNYLIYEFKTPGRYEVCIKTETPDCPNGSSYCKVIEIEEQNEDCTDIAFSRDGDYLYERSGKERSYSWSIDGQTLDDQEVILEEGRKFSLKNLESGTYKICISVVTDECPEGAEFCKEIVIENDSETKCPDLFFVAERDGNNPAYHFEAEFEGMQNIEWLGWFIDGELVEDSNNGDHNKFYYQFAPGKYEVCLKTETPECPQGTSYCKVIEIEDQNENCSDIAFSRDGDYLYERTGKERMYTWSMDGQTIDDQEVVLEEGRKFSLKNLQPGTYNICISVVADECPNGAQFCEEVVIQ